MGYQSKFKGSEIDEAIVEVKDHREQILNIEEYLIPSDFNENFNEDFAI
jgi:hypothetical protein